MSEQKVAVVLGVGPGLGAALARRFAREGFALGLMARNETTLAPVQQAIERSGGRAMSVAADASVAASVASAFARVREQLGAPDIFVYNAGAFQMGGILDVTAEQFEACWKANCLGGFLGAQQVLPAMLERKRGTILLTGATASLRGAARFACLSVGKFGLRALAQALAREFGPQGIHVAHVIVDGVIDTPRTRRMFGARGADTLLSPEAIAETYWQLYSQDPTAWTLEIDVRPAVEKF